MLAIKTIIIIYTKEKVVYLITLFLEKQPYVVFKKRHIFVLGKRRCFRKSVQFWKLSKTANFGPHGRPNAQGWRQSLGLAQ